MTHYMDETVEEHGPGGPPPASSPRLERLVYGLGGAVLVAAVLALLAWLHSTHADRTASHARDAASVASSVAVANNSAAKKLAHQVETLGHVPVVQPSQLPTVKGEPGAAGPTGPGPSDAQIDASVARWCADHSNCTGVPSAAQVAAALHAYCSGGTCTGPAGRNATGSAGQNGSNGQAGQDGAAGPTGPGPSDDQVAAAVDAYCTAHGQCAGAAGTNGTDGQNGTDGKDGRGITSVECSALIPTDTFTIHYDDGSTQTVTCTPPAGG